MSRKTFAQTFILIFVLLAFFAVPRSVSAGGLCGGMYTVDPGDTLEKIATTCGMSVADIYTANPGISSSLYTGQVLNLAATSGTSNGATFTIYNPPTNPNPIYTGPIYTNPVYTNPVQTTFNGVYIVQRGDTFSGIASRFGVNMYTLWAANPHVWNINILYVGQVLYIPGSLVPVPVLEFPETPAHLSAGTVPPGTPNGKVHLSNQANADVYVSLQGETRDGFNPINEYTVHGNMNVRVPAGWYTYVAWVGGHKYVGQFNLGGGSDRTIIFYSNQVVVQ